MESNLTKQEWSDLINRANPLEFGWIGIDQLKQIAYFSTFGRAYIPDKVMSSYDRYIELAEFVNNLPEICSSKLYTKEKGRFNIWHFHSKRGLIAYDFLDVHRNENERLNRYDLITFPERPITYDLIPNMALYNDIIARFSLDFNNNTSFKDLQAAEC